MFMWTYAAIERQCMQYLVIIAYFALIYRLASVVHQNFEITMSRWASAPVSLSNHSSCPPFLILCLTRNRRIAISNINSKIVQLWNLRPPDGVLGNPHYGVAYFFWTHAILLITHIQPRNVIRIKLQLSIIQDLQVHMYIYCNLVFVCPFEVEAGSRVEP